MAQSKLSVRARVTSKHASILTATLFAVLMVVSSNLAAQMGSQSAPLVRLTESVIDLSTYPPSTSWTCVAVDRNGGVYMRARTQIIPGPVVQKAYKGVLTSFQMSGLQNLLNDGQLASLPRGGSPHIPASSPIEKIVGVKLYQGNSTYVIQTADWADKQGIHRQNATREYIQVQTRIEQAIQPLMKWVHGVSLIGLHEAEVDSSLCGDIDASN